MTRLQEIANRLTEIRTASDTATEEQITAFETELRDLQAEKTLLEKRESLKNGIPVSSGTPAVFDNPENNPESRSAEEDKYATIEYRKAFMEFAKTGKAVPAGFEARADAFTAVTDAAAVVPTTILDEMISKMETYGQLFARVRKMSIKGGVTVPILSLKPVATWINETTPSDRQKVQANTKVTFTYFGLECKVATSLLAETVTLASFESTVVQLIVEAMTKAIDLAIIKGEGTASPTGITVDTRIPAGNKVDMLEADMKSWSAWKEKVFAKIPLAYRAGGTFIMAPGTFEQYIDGMVDTTGQPIGRVNYGITDGPQERFGGKEVILVEDDVIAPYDSAADGDVIGIFCKLSDYAINSNMQLAMYRWLDHDTNQYVDKAILIADGKILDPNGVLLIRKDTGV